MTFKMESCIRSFRLGLENGRSSCVFCNFPGHRSTSTASMRDSPWSGKSITSSRRWNINFHHFRFDNCERNSARLTTGLTFSAWNLVQMRSMPQSIATHDCRAQMNARILSIRFDWTIQTVFSSNARVESNRETKRRKKKAKTKTRNGETAKRKNKRKIAFSDEEKCSPWRQVARNRVFEWCLCVCRSFFYELLQPVWDCVFFFLFISSRFEIVCLFVCCLAWKWSKSLS